jgi:hypothetical protein
MKMGSDWPVMAIFRQLARFGLPTNRALGILVEQIS